MSITFSTTFFGPFFFVLPKCLYGKSLAAICRQSGDMATFTEAQGTVQTRSAAALAARHPQCDAAMIEGITSVFRQWTALELAIFHQWGGSPEETMEDMKNELMSMFTGPEKVYKDDVSFILEDYMESNFNTVCDDGSAEELGAVFVEMWRKCRDGDFEMVQGILEKERKRVSVTGQCQGLEGGDAIDEDSEDESDGLALNKMVRERALEALTEEESGEKMEYGDEGDVDGKEAPPLMDADGFTTVVAGKKKKNKGGK